MLLAGKRRNFSEALSKHLSPQGGEPGTAGVETGAAPRTSELPQGSATPLLDTPEDSQLPEQRDQCTPMLATILSTITKK